MKLKTRGAAKSLSLALDTTCTSTWPPKGRGRDAAAEAGRPRTATLDKPVVLDIALLGHLDMTTLTRRGLLNVCRKGVAGVLAATPSPRPARRASRASRASSRSDASGDELQATPVAGRRPRGAGTALVRQKKAVIEEDLEDESSWADEEQRFATYRVPRNNRLNRTFRIPTLRKQRQPLDNLLNNNEPAMDLKPARRRGLGLGLGLDLEDILAAREQVPEPCRTCGRPELPERLHSHPKQPGKAGKPAKGHLPLAAPPPPRGQPELAVRNAVKKPIAIKYRPRRGSEGADVDTPAPAGKAAPRRSSPSKGSPSGKAAFLVTHFVDADGPAARGPRIVACFVCGREFGTASLPLHEPQCIQRWHLQNSKLSPRWQRRLPEKPTGPITVEDWNKFAWDSSKGVIFVSSAIHPNPPHPPLPTMTHAGEDFALVVYGSDDDPRPRAPPPAPPPPHPQDHPASAAGKDDVEDRRIVPPASRKAYMEVLRTNWFHLKSDEYLRADSVQCPNCLRRFCPDRINSHERVCFKKQHAVGGEPQSQCDSIGSMGSRGTGGRTSPLVECYLCGKKFGSRSIGIHEPQCLKKWQQLNGEEASPRASPHAIDKPRDCPQLEGPSECKPLAIEFPTKAPTPAPGPGPGPAPTPGRTPGAGKADRARTTSPPEQAKIKSAWVGEDGVVLPEASAPASGQPRPAKAQATPAAAAARKTAPHKAGSRGRPLRCYLCGQMFGLQSLSIHEPQCLQKWRLENAKLPANLQRPEPQKPEIVFTDTGAVDIDASAEAAWQAHLSQLIPCTHCGRKFSPDRISVHERCCKGSER